MRCCRIAGLWRLSRRVSRDHSSRSRQIQGTKTLPPSVECAFLQPSQAAVSADRLAGRFLLDDPLAPQFKTPYLFRLHASTMRRDCRIGQRGLCDAYSITAVIPEPAPRGRAGPSTGEAEPFVKEQGP
jgi:hypothetical protein